MPLHLRRYQQEGHLHFITFSCHRRLPHLNSNTAYTCFERWLETLRQRHDFDVHGYVLMPGAPSMRLIAWVGFCSSYVLKHKPDANPWSLVTGNWAVAREYDSIHRRL